MNTTANITDRIEARLVENKASVKTYKTYAVAYATAEKLAKDFDTANGTDVGVPYIVTMLPTTQRWTVVFDLSNWIARSGRGCYLGWFAVRGFFCV